MGASSNLARLHGERIGHLSRYDSTDLLREELSAIAGLLQPAPAKFAFRKAFFGSGGKQEHWDTYAAPLLEAAAAAPDPSQPHTPPQAAVSPADDALAADSQLTVAESAPASLDMAAGVDADRAQMLDDPESPREEDLPWQQLTAELAEADDDEAEESAEPEPAGDDVDEQAEDAVELSNDSSLSVSQIAQHGLAVKVEGSFGAGQYGGSRFLDEVGNAVEAGTSGVLLDLSGLSTLRPDSTAPILAAQIKVQAVGGQLAIVRPSGSPAAILDATGLTQRIDCFDDENSALEFLMPVCEGAPIA